MLRISLPVYFTGLPCYFTGYPVYSQVDMLSVGGYTENVVGGAFENMRNLGLNSTTISTSGLKKPKHYFIDSTISLLHSIVTVT